MNNEHESSEQDYFGFYENLSDREKSLGKLDKPLKFVEEVVEMKELEHKYGKWMRLIMGLFMVVVGVWLLR